MLGPCNHATALAGFRQRQNGYQIPLVPTLAATLGVKGHRPEVGTPDNKGLLYVLAVMCLTTLMMATLGGLLSCCHEPRYS